MSKMWIVVGTTLVLALTINARSLTPVDVPDPPKALHPMQFLPVAPRTLPRKASPEEMMEAMCVRDCALGVTRPECRCHEEPAPRPRLCTLACQLADAGEDCHCTIVTDNSPLAVKETRITITKDIVLSISMPLGESREASTTTPPPQPSTNNQQTTQQLTTKTTTLDPFEEFCKEACEEGVGGAECDCADHPIG